MAQTSTADPRRRRPRPPQPNAQRRPRPAGPPARRTPVLAWIALGIGGLLAAVIGATVILLTMISPASFVQDRLIAEVEQATGRKLTIAGGSGLSFWPDLAISLADVELSAPPGFNAPPTLKAERLALSVELVPLFSGSAVIKSVVISRPEIELFVDRSGRRSWTLGRAVPPVELAQAGRATVGVRALTDDLQSRSLVPVALPLAGPGVLTREQYRDLIQTLEVIEFPESIEIKEGKVTYRDARIDVVERVQDINLVLRPQRLAATDRFSADFSLNADGTLLLRGEKIRLTRLETSSVEKLLLDGQGTIRSEIGSEATTVKVSVEPLSLAPEVTMKAEASITSRSIDEISRLFGVRLPESTQLGGVALVVANATLNGDGRIVLPDFSLTLGDMSARGRLRLDTRGDRPKLVGDISTTSLLDVDRIRAAFAAPHQDKASDEPSQNSKKRTTKGGERNGWSTDPIALAVLGAIDGDLTLTLRGLKLDRVSIGGTQGRLQMNGGRVKARLDRMSLYGGTGTALVTGDPTEDGVSFGANVQLRGVAVRDLFGDLADIKSLDGQGDIDLAVAARGLSEFDLVSTVKGTASMVVRDGAIVGWDIPAMLQGAEQLKLPSLKRSEDARTKFVEMVARYDIERGVAQTRDFRIDANQIEVVGEGTITLPTRTLDKSFRSTLRTSSTSDQADYGVTVAVTGDWESPSIRPTKIDGVSDKLGDVIKGLTGDEDTANSATKLLNKFLGGNR